MMRRAMALTVGIAMIDELSCSVSYDSSGTGEAFLFHVFVLHLHAFLKEQKSPWAMESRFEMDLRFWKKKKYQN